MTSKFYYGFASGPPVMIVSLDRRVQHRRNALPMLKIAEANEDDETLVEICKKVSLGEYVLSPEDELSFNHQKIRFSEFFKVT